MIARDNHSPVPKSTCQNHCVVGTRQPYLTDGNRIMSGCF
jgi:hypothetical protein